MGQIQTIGDFVSMLRRRFMLIAVIAFAGIVLSIVYAMKQPRLFEAASVIQVETPLIADDTAQPGSGAQLAQSVQLIEQRLMVRENMLAVIAKHGLFSELGGLSLNEKAVMLRQAMRIERVSAVRPGQMDDGRVSALIIAVQLGSAEAAAAVANDFAASLLQTSSSTRAERAKATLAFYLAEESQISGEISALEAELAEFKSLNGAALPESLSERRDEVIRIENSIALLDDQMNALDRERSALGFYGDVGTGQTVSEQLELLELELEQARLKYIARAPELLALEARIAAIKGGSNDAQQALTQRQIVDLTSQITTLLDQRAGLAARRASLEDSISMTPGVQMELSNFDRRLQQLQDRFDATSRQRAAAEIAQRLEVNQQAERFELLEPAIVPDYAIAPSRKKLVAAGGMASIVLAIGIAFLLELLNPVIQTSAQLHREIDIHPVISIPYVAGAREAQGILRLRILQGILAAIGLIVIAGLLLALRMADVAH